MPGRGAAVTSRLLPAGPRLLPAGPRLLLAWLAAAALLLPVGCARAAGERSGESAVRTETEQLRGTAPDPERARTASFALG